MSIFSNIIQVFRKSPEVPILTKAPGFAVTSFTSNNPFTNLIEPESNYFDQYILWTFKSIDYIANKVASSKIRLYDISNDREIEKKDRRFEVMSDLTSFNPFMNLWEARKLREIHLMLTGAAYWYIDRRPMENARAEFYPLDPNNMQIKTDSRGLPSYWLYKDADGKLVELDTRDIIYFKRTNPKNWFEGLSQVKQMSFWTNAYAQGAQYNMSKLGNNANVDKFIVFEGIGDEEREKIEEQLRNKYGGAKNAGRTGILRKKPEIIDVSSNQKDLDYVNGMKMLRQDILAGFGIPEALFFPSATNSNSKEARTLFQSDTLEPLLQQEKAALDEQLLRKYLLLPQSQVTIYFKFDDVVEKDKESLVNQAVKLTNSGIYTRNQALEYIGDEKVPDGDVYLNSNQSSNEEEETKLLYAKALTLKEKLDELVKKQEKEEILKKALKMAEEQEGIMYQSAKNLFQDQFTRTIKYINETDKPTVRGIFNLKEEAEIVKDTFKESYAKVIGNSNDVGNIEIKQKLLKSNSSKLVNYRVKSISQEAINDIAKHLDYFANETSKVTRDQLRKLLVQGIDKGFDKSEFRKSIEDLFNGFIDGKFNIKLLKKYGFYQPSLSVDNEGNINTSTGNRYKVMLASITQAWGNGDITKSERDDCLKALRGLIDPSDPIGREVDALLTTVYHTNIEKGIKHSRAVTIARTEATYARNLGFYDVYNENPFVAKKTWNSLHDQDVRDSHAKVDGKSIPVNEAFQLDGGKMRFPGDGSLGAGAEEIVHCRCRITGEVK